MKNIAIIGAGLAGITAAHQLRSHAHITVFEKARGVSGRLSTRRAEPYHFDHGAPFFKVRTQEFSDFLAPLIGADVVQRWDARFAEIDGTTIVNQRQWGPEFVHYVGAPGMNAALKNLAQGIDVRLGCRVTKITRDDATQLWNVSDEHGNSLGLFDWVICSVPAQQAAELVPSSLPMYQRIATTKMTGCYALMVGLNPAQHATLDISFDCALIRNSDLSWISVNNSKPNRPDHLALTILSSNQWAEDHIEDDQATVQTHLLTIASKTLGYDLHNADHLALHRWRYANIAKQTGANHLIDTQNNIGICGDWLIKGQVESAFLSARTLTESLEPHL